MKNFLAVFMGSPAAMDAWMAMPETDRKAKEQQGMQGWMKWAQDHEKDMVYPGAPLGKTTVVNKSGMSNTRNEMGAFVVVKAATVEEAAKMFENHPHFMIFPGDRVEIMECMPIPKM